MFGPWAFSTPLVVMWESRTGDKTGDMSRFPFYVRQGTTSSLRDLTFEGPLPGFDYSPEPTDLGLWEPS